MITNDYWWLLTVIQHSHLIGYVLENMANHTLTIYVQEIGNNSTNTPTKVLDYMDPMTTPSRNTLGPQSFRWVLHISSSQANVVHYKTQRWVAPSVHSWQAIGKTSLGVAGNDG
jgi:hypothetical protein